MDGLTLGLLGILLAVLVLPFLVRRIEENLEAFLLVMGLLASGIAGTLHRPVIRDALVHPIPITLAVLAAGLLFHLGESRLRSAVARWAQRVSLPGLVFLAVSGLGLLSSVITAIIASLVLVELMHALPLERRPRVVVTVLACYAIGLGAALTPIGEPLATIAVAKKQEDFDYLIRLLGAYVVPGVLAFGAASAWVARRAARAAASPSEAAPAGEDALPSRAPVASAAAADPPGGEAPEPAAARPEATGARSLRPVAERAVRVYVFVMALVLLGEGFKPFIERYLLPLDSRWLYWLNMISAVVDNATLTAAEIDVRMSDPQVQAILMGLLISGGMLIPGNIPNIIAAHRLRIGSREWARVGVPVGLVTLAVAFAALFWM